MLLACVSISCRCPTDSTACDNLAIFLQGHDFVVLRHFASTYTFDHRRLFRCIVPLLLRFCTCVPVRLSIRFRFRSRLVVTMSCARCRRMRFRTGTRRARTRIRSISIRSSRSRSRRRRRRRRRRRFRCTGTFLLNHLQQFRRFGCREQAERLLTEPARGGEVPCVPMFLCDGEAFEGFVFVALHR